MRDLAPTAHRAWARIVLILLAVSGVDGCSTLAARRENSDSRVEPSGNPSPLGREAAVLELVIDNPFRLAFDVVEVSGDDDVRIVSQESSRRWRQPMRAGLYEVVAHGGSRSFGLPAPLLRGVVPDGRLTITIPAAQPEDETWAWIPRGVSVMGDTIGVGQEDERPAHLVELPDFWIGRTEVTNADYVRFLNDPAVSVDERWLAFDSLKCLVRQDQATRRWTTDSPAFPVVTVSLSGAEAYCRWMTSRTSVPHRLPTEAEWEKAARGPRSTVYDYGSTFRRFAANQQSGRLREVNAYGLHGFGVADLTGNAFEWVADDYDPDAYAGRDSRFTSSPSIRHASSAADTRYHVLRGGSFVLDGMYLRNSFRMRQRPSVRTEDFGFRVVRESRPDAEVITSCESRPG